MERLTEWNSDHTHGQVIGNCDAYTRLAQYEDTDLTPEQILEKLEELEKAKEVIRKLLCSEYGSTCQFCIHDENPDAMCSNIGGSGSWCCENSRWNGKIE